MGVLLPSENKLHIYIFLQDLSVAHSGPSFAVTAKRKFTRLIDTPGLGLGSMLSNRL